jgi:heme-degrading monooxygenase HmoA
MARDCDERSIDRRETGGKETLLSVLMTLRVAGDGTKIEALASEDPSLLQKIVDRAKEHGLISHRFFGTEDEVLVVDEWPSPEAFQSFFDASPEIRGVMDRAGVTSQPEIKFWRKLDTKDEVG